MSDFQVICTRQTTCDNGGHILEVGLSSTQPGKYGQLMTVQQVWDAIDAGHRFFTREDGNHAWVTKWNCGCKLGGTLRSAPDTSTANNLDSLSRCV